MWCNGYETIKTEHATSDDLDIYDTAGMSSTSNLRVPALCVRVTCAPSSPLTQMLNETSTSYADMVRGLGGLATASVPLPAESVLLSTAHPVLEPLFIVSRQTDGLWSLPARDIALERSSTHPLAMIVPGLRLQVQCAGAPGSDRSAYSHLLSCSVPLAACFKDLLARNVHTLQRVTCEDGMQYLVQIMAGPRTCEKRPTRVRFVAFLAS
jgi:hypothetical protein